VAQATTAEKAWLVGGVAAGVAALVWAWWPRPKSGVKRIALIGDSYAVGLTAPMQALAASAGVPFQAQGVVSTTPSQWASGAAACGACGSWVPAFYPSATLVILGINDLGYSPSPPVAPYQQIVRKFPNVAWILPPVMPNDRLAGVRSVIQSLGVPTIPAMTSGLSFASDGIHLTNYAPLARWIWRYL
jgi:hypothetical protein